MFGDLDKDETSDMGDGQILLYLSVFLSLEASWDLFSSFRDFNMDGMGWMVSLS